MKKKFTCSDCKKTFIIEIEKSSKHNWYLQNKERLAESYKQYRESHKEQHKKSSKKYREAHKEKFQILAKKYQETHKEELKLYQKKYHSEHREEINLKAKQRRQKDINYKLGWYLRARVRSALIRNSKLGTTSELLGCDIEFLKKYLESQFKNGMSWSNYGDWHIDHKLPCISFDLSKKSEQLKCFHYTNLQPLWAIDNWHKHDNILIEAEPIEE